MREVCWRAQDLATKKWVYGDLITTLRDIDNDGNEVYQPCYIYQEQSLANGNNRYIHFSINPKTVGEYIGKKDRNRRRIYEWDIIRIDICGDIQNYLVSYDSENARFVVGNTDIIFWSDFSERAEVIGNLFDNPNLIDDELIIKEDLK